ncbi:ATP-binding protein [Nostoc sp. DedQUE07]|uniref:hybrid sensor histidine kinase/response regulator n=1 Tax=Nostoc sp. DedQUE07 TaxID=3075392 RepID=UPI002AD518EA|nr:ATP-binding protein [Nostoc sp. DedQUE07]MDZ8128677.1 ATP-binding protein [Nostoc sp. DedQUE07]
MDNPKILVVEDEVLIARELETNLMSLGYTIVGIAGNGAEAIAKAAELQPNLILMDIMLPGEIDGIEAVERIHQTAPIPAIYISAYDDETILERAKATHPLAYLIKPFNERVLRTTIEIALALHTAESEIGKAIEIAQRQTKAESQPKQQQLNPLFQNYLGMVVHEIGNSISVIQVSAELLNEFEAPPLVKQRAIERIQNAALRMNWLREDLLVLVQTGTNQYQLQLTEIELLSTAQQLIEIVTVQQRQDRLRLLSQQETLVAFMDERLLNYLLKNLLLNALKYSPEDTSILLLLDRQADRVEIEVRDRGIGIPADYYPNIFQPFHRGSNVADIPGTGLGLAIVKRCVDLLRGDITFDSEVGKGTTFRVTLPVTRPSSEQKISVDTGVR